MKLKRYLYKKNIMISIIASLIYAIIITFVCWKAFSYIRQKEIESKKVLFKEFIRMKLSKGNIILRNIRNNREINIYLQEGLMLDSVPYKIKVDGNWYYHYSNNSINRYRISTLIKNAVEENEDVIIDIYTYRGKPKIVTSGIPINLELLKNVDSIHDFGEINYIYVDKKNVYIQFYGLDEKKENILVMNMKMTDNFIYEIDKIGIKLIIAEEKTGRVAVSSFFGSEKILYFSNPEEKTGIEINGENYKIFSEEGVPWNLQKGYIVYLAQKSNFENIIGIIVIGISVVALLVFINIMIILRNGTKESVKIINGIRRNIKEDKDGNYMQIDEYKEIMSEIKEYKQEKDEQEKRIEIELENKSKNITELYERIKIQNDFLKIITIFEKLEDVLPAGFNALNKIAKIKELKFSTNLKGENEIKIIKILENGIIEESYEKVTVMEEFLHEGNKIKIENQFGGVICMMFKTENITVGILSIFYETKNLIQENSIILSELMEMLIVSLKSAKFYEMSLKDSLTGLYNRGIMNFYLKKMMEENKNSEENTFSVMLIDIDRFKKINSGFGYITGDYILKKIATDITKYLRREDIIFRYGGEEFLVIMPKMDRKGAFIVADRIRKQIEESSLKLDKIFNKEIEITVSIGIVQFNNGIHKNIQDIIIEVDEKMYSAKRKGKNRCEM